MSYIIKRASNVKLEDSWNGTVWGSANVIDIDIFREQSSDHHPKTQCKLLYNEQGIYGLFQVEDQYVRSVSTKFQDGVCGDSCVEFFVEPANGKGYLNFEFNCGGNMLVFQVIDAARGENGFADFYILTEDDVAGMQQFTTMPPLVEPEITEPTTWRRGFFIPLSVFEKTTGLQSAELSGQIWRANLYKCADRTSHPHWASWKPITETNFHLPQCFSEITFE
ncbi:MAG: carbohydrate-binding family 9-like protein [Victivallaceae bacterium]|nr:carbohydrate-binding family 9-like protein [Victivallaceae bacterium]